MLQIPPASQREPALTGYSRATGPSLPVGTLSRGKGGFGDGLFDWLSRLLKYKFVLDGNVLSTLHRGREGQMASVCIMTFSRSSLQMAPACSNPELRQVAVSVKA